MNECLSCGAPNAEGVLYCGRCRQRLAPPAPPPESWRYSGDLNRPLANQPNRPSAYQPPPVYQSYPTSAPQPAQPPNTPAPNQPQYPTPFAVPPASTNRQLAQIGMTLGIIIGCIAVLGLIPCLGWLNWFTLILGKITLILCIVALVTEKDPNYRSKAVIGLVITATALVIGIVRLIIGGGCL
jgi:hypothetical protein